MLSTKVYELSIGIPFDNKEPNCLPKIKNFYYDCTIYALYTAVHCEHIHDWDFFKFFSEVVISRKEE